MSVVEMKVPVIGESVTEVTLSQWLVSEGDVVSMDQAICEFESDKATLEFPAEAAGKISFVAAEGDDLEIGALVAKIDTSVAAPAAKEETSAPVPVKEEAKEEAPAQKEAPAPAMAESNGNGSYAKGHPSPAASKILAEKNIAPADVSGTGKDGRITKEDALKASKTSTAPAPTPAAKSPATATQFSRETSSKKMSRMRRTIAARLVSAKNETAMLTTFNEVDLTEVMALRKKYQEDFVKKYGVKLGFMSIFAKACAKLLIEMPDVNGLIEDDINIVHHDYADISFAISTPTGLVVPPIKNCESLHFADIELKLKELAGKARDGSLSLDEMSGGTFTITNGGVFGSMLSTPIINKPQSAILGMHNIIQRPMAINGEVKIRPMMYLALSYDHRIIDGSTSVTFLKKVKELLEDPYKMFLDI
jgi:2-oxoglutarate dehydrogenase E2 component (dihydrolipoamide succinyltransferase)